MRWSFALLLCASALAAQDVEYWPLAPGNEWVYRTALGSPVTMTVLRNESAGGQTYAVVSGFGGNVWLRQDGARLMIYDAETKTERVYVDFGAPLNRETPAFPNECNTTAAITSREAREKLPLGTFGDLVAVRYGGNRCADAGLTQDLFRPYLGLMRRTETSFIGPRVYDLVYARINGVLMVSTAETGFAVNVAEDERGWLVRMTLRNTTGVPVKLEFSSSQSFDIVVKDAKGEAVYRWSADKVFLAALQPVVEVSGERSWAALIPRPKIAGRYAVEAWLTSVGGEPYRAVSAVAVE